MQEVPGQKILDIMRGGWVLWHSQKSEKRCQKIHNMFPIKKSVKANKPNEICSKTKYHVRNTIHLFTQMSR